MIHIYREPGPAGYLQIGRLDRSPWVTIWHGGFTMSLSGNRLLCFRTPRERAYYSERNGLQTRHLFRWRNWRLFIRDLAA